MNLDIAKRLYEIVDEAVNVHLAIKNGLIDAVFWNNVVPTKEGGNLCLRVILDNTNSEKNKLRIKSLRDYWNENYNLIKSQVFYRDNPDVDIPKRK